MVINMRLFSSKKFDDSAFLNANALPLKPLSGEEAKARTERSVSKAVEQLIPFLGLKNEQADVPPDPFSHAYFVVRETATKIHLTPVKTPFLGYDTFVVQSENTKISIIPQANVTTYKTEIKGVALMTENLERSSLAFKVLKGALNKLGPSDEYELDELNFDSSVEES